MDTQYDAAFGKTAPMGTGGSVPAEDIAKLQRALNVMGFGPIATDGQMSEQLNTTLFKLAQMVPGAFSYSGTVSPDVVQAVLKLQAGGGQLTPSGSSNVTKSPEAVAAELPFYKRPVVMLGAAAAGIIAYVMWRSSSSESKPVAGVETKPRKRKTEKCGRAPEVDFDDGEEVEVDVERTDEPSQELSNDAD